MKQLHKHLLMFAVLVFLPLLACGPLNSDGGEPTAPPATESVAASPTAGEQTAEEPTTPPSPTPPPPTPTEAPAAISDLQAVEQAVVQIVAQGSFVDPQEGLLLNEAGAGSGFIIDPSGIAVTNNHVVTGAALLQVYVAGEDEPRNARVLGVSECSDLAVIDIDGEGFPFLDWYAGEINVGLDVYAAGFPLGDPEFTLTRGIVSKADAGGETSWASVDEVLAHDATINPGNSGGPLVDSNGAVIGVNYAGLSAADQYFAIKRNEALDIIDQLRQGQDVTSIGVNGFAIADQEQDIYGIWVSSVESGSPADETGVEPGDIITKLEGLVLATDGTMSSYCDILRSRERGSTMSIQVLRLSAQEVLEGQLNGDELEMTVAFSQQLDEQVAEDGSAAGGETYSEYVTVSDNSGQLEVEVPAAWSDVAGEPWTNDEGEELGPSVTAAPDLNAFNNSWTTPGVFFAAVPSDV
ncbi:MAG: trypsin-like peptidase domain-containing protein, partial [Candidatus Promineifilaceae bacterium]|nr:trypsin-like peptidase domain-containing protein [Candidatus Promineifilaceae bacterium]